MKRFEFDTEEYGLDTAMSNIFGGGELCRLHELLGSLIIPCVEFAGDQDLIYHKIAYANIKWQFISRFHQFVKKVIKPRFSEPIIYQKIPSIRFQLPENKGVGKFHCDSDYGHLSHETNFYVPLTVAQDTSTIWVETEPGKEDYTPFPKMYYGDAMEWDGANFKHGNKVNQTGLTRVSFDFRTLPLHLYDEKDGASRRTTNLGKRFVIGEYFAICED